MTEKPEINPGEWIYVGNRRAVVCGIIDSKLAEFSGDCEVVYMDGGKAINENVTYGSPIFKAVQKKQYKALYREPTRSPLSPEYAVGVGSKW